MFISKPMFASKLLFAYFDLGGVVFDWEKGLTKLAELSGKPLERVKEVFKKYDDDACRGKLTPEDFGKHYERELEFSLNGVHFSDFWVSNFRPILKTHTLLKRLVAGGVPVGLLTNIYKGTYEKALGKYVPDLPYKAVVKSCDCGYIKPELEFLELAQSLTGVPKSEVILIDDCAINIEKARDFGWRGIVFQKDVAVDIYS